MALPAVVQLTYLLHLKKKKKCTHYIGKTYVHIFKIFYFTIYSLVNMNNKADATGKDLENSQIIQIH